MIELLNKVWEKKIYPIFLGTPDEELSLLNTLEEIEYAELKSKNCYVITLKGKLRILYEFLKDRYKNLIGTEGGFAEDCYFEENQEWFKNHELDENQYYYYKTKLFKLGLLERANYGSAFRVLDVDFEENYETDQQIHILYNSGNIQIGDSNEIS